MSLFFKRCICCRKIRWRKKMIYVTLSEFPSGYMCDDCLKRYMRSSIMGLKDYLVSERFQTDPLKAEKLKVVNMLLDFILQKTKGL